METKEAIEVLKEIAIKIQATGMAHDAIAMAINALELQQAMDECESCKIEPVYEITLERA